MVFVGKPKELSDFLAGLRSRFGGKQKLIAICIMLEKEFYESKFQI